MESHGRLYKKDYEGGPCMVEREIFSNKQTWQWSVDSRSCVREKDIVREYGIGKRTLKIVKSRREKKKLRK